MKIAITSGSKHKIGALQKALDQLHMDAEIIVMKGSSNINEQPFGLDQTWRGARNRIRNSKWSLETDLILSIENGIDLIDGYSVKDFAVVMLTNKTGETVWEISQTVTFPYLQYEKALEAGFDKHTVGSFLEADGIVKDGTDPHFELGGISRVDIMCNTIVSCLIQVGLGKK